MLAMSKTIPEPAHDAVAITGEGEAMALAGVLDVHSLGKVKKTLASWLAKRTSRTLDLDKLGGLDTSGALFLCELRNRHVALTGLSAEHAQLLDMVCDLERKPLAKPKAISAWRESIVDIGKSVDDIAQDTYGLIAFVGRAVEALAQA